jgi:putative transposase
MAQPHLLNKLWRKALRRHFGGCASKRVCQVFCECSRALPATARLKSVERRLLAYTLMPNHWHLVLWPRRDGELSDFGHWLTMTRTQRWHAHYPDVGTGHLYQGRFNPFPVAAEHFLQLCRYVERNALRAGMVPSAAEWRWGSLWQRQHGTEEMREILSAWPVPQLEGWLEYVDAAQSEAELEAIRRAVRRGQPLGSAN